MHRDHDWSCPGLVDTWKMVWTFPKGMYLSNIHQERLNAVARKFNERPQRTLNIRTPAERFSQNVTSTG